MGEPRQQLYQQDYTPESLSAFRRSHTEILYLYGPAILLYSCSFSGTKLKGENPKTLALKKLNKRNSKKKGHWIKAVYIPVFQFGLISCRTLNPIKCVLCQWELKAVASKPENTEKKNREGDREKG